MVHFIFLKIQLLFMPVTMSLKCPFSNRFIKPFSHFYSSISLCCLCICLSDLLHYCTNVSSDLRSIHQPLIRRARGLVHLHRVCYIFTSHSSVINPEPCHLFMTQALESWPKYTVYVHAMLQYGPLQYVQTFNNFYIYRNFFFTFR